MSAQDQVQADASAFAAATRAMSGAAASLDNANAILKAGVPAATYTKMHPYLAMAAGLVGPGATAAQAAELAAVAWLQANPVPVTPPITPPSTYTPPVPVGTVAFDDDFLGSSLGPAWYPGWFGPGGSMNNVTCAPGNVTVANSIVTLTLLSKNSGALISTNPDDGVHASGQGFAYQYGYMDWFAQMSLEAWCALWSTGQNWPTTGEIDDAEALSNHITSNYHSSTGANNGPNETVPAGFNHFGVNRQVDKNDVYVNGDLVRSYATQDGGAPQYLVANIGQSSGEAVVGSQLLVDRVTIWEAAQ